MIRCAPAIDRPLAAAVLGLRTTPLNVLRPLIAGVRRPTRRRCSMPLLVLGAALWPCILLAQVPRVADIPDGVSGPQRQQLTQARDLLLAKRNELASDAADHNRRCSAVAEHTPDWNRCSAEQARLESDRRQYVEAVNRFNERAVNAEAEPPRLPTAAPGARIGATAECRGGVFMITADGQPLPLQGGDAVPLNAHLTTGPDGHLKLVLPDRTTFTVGPGSDIVLDEFVYDPDTSMRRIAAEVIKGTFRWVTGKVVRGSPQSMQVKLAVGVIGIRGTDFEAGVAADGSGYVELYSGHLQITASKTGAVLLMDAGQAVTYTAGGTFSAPGPLPTRSRP